MSNIICNEFIKELDAETTSTRKCLERIPMELSDYRPHEKSMPMGSLALLIADIPKWISLTIDKSEIDFATYEHFKPKNNYELVRFFDENIERAKNSLQNISDEDLASSFSLKNKGEILFTSRKQESISSSINHMVHHRGQLTVYMRMNNIPVPSIYGPSGDEQGF